MELHTNRARVGLWSAGDEIEDPVYRRQDCVWDMEVSSIGELTITNRDPIRWEVSLDHVITHVGLVSDYGSLGRLIPLPQVCICGPGATPGFDRGNLTIVTRPD